MKSEEVIQLFNQLRYEQDVRNPPDNRRHGQFKAGWQDATIRGEGYVDTTLNSLTWRNLGYRFGNLVGPKPEDEINQAYDALADLYLSKYQVAPTAQQYVAAFQAINDLPSSYVAMLRFHYYAQSRTVTAVQIAHAVGFQHHGTANLHYGKLGRRLGSLLHFHPTKMPVDVLVMQTKPAHEWLWTMRPQVAQALEHLGWVEGPLPFMPNDEPTSVSLAAVRELLTRQEDEFEKTNSFDPTNQEDARERLVAEIVRRRGQPGFRRKLLMLYEGRCAISGCEVEATLEAAHIVPYRGPETNHPANGLLLRADLHMLFDLGLIAVDTATMTVLIAPELEGTWYAQYGDVALRLPQASYGQPSREALDIHRKAAGLTNRSTSSPPRCDSAEPEKSRLGGSR